VGFSESPQKMVVSADNYLPNTTGRINYHCRRFNISPFYLYVVLKKRHMGFVAVAAVFTAMGKDEGKWGTGELLQNTLPTTIAEHYSLICGMSGSI
jgi:hypothetical protein